MSKYSVIKSRSVLVVCFTVLSAISGLASCGGAKLSTSSDQYRSPNIYVSASPTLIAYGAANTTSRITWTSLAGDCTSSPSGITGASGTFITPPLTETTTYILTCGSESKKVTIALAPASTVTPITAVQAAWAAEPVRGTEYYYCDCGPGAQGDCVAGDDANAGTSPDAPRQTIANAVTLDTSLGATLHTISFCKGGALEVASSAYLRISACTTGTTCRDWREYAPSVAHGGFAGINTPLIVNPTSSYAFTLTRGANGIRFMNLSMKGTDPGSGGVYIYEGAHDITIGNVKFQDFKKAVTSETAGSITVTNIELTGNTFIDNTSMAFLGAADGLDLNYNYFSGNGGANNRDHSVYLGSHVPVHTVNMVGNYFYGQYGNTCLGVVAVAHGPFDGLNILNNHIEVSKTETTGGCWGISLSHGGYQEEMYFRNTVIGGNTSINGGNAPITWASAPGIIVENNLIIQDWSYGPGWGVGGMGAPVDQARTTPADDVNTANTIRNNTIWFGPTSNGGVSQAAIGLGTEGTGHIITNNTITYSSSTVGQGVNCFNLTLAASAYSVMDNNHCHSATAYKWEKTNGATLAAWQLYSSKDASSIAGSAPLFNNATSASGYNFKPTGSPLIGAGSNTYKSTLDALGITRPNPPAIGAFEP